MLTLLQYTLLLPTARSTTSMKRAPRPRLELYFYSMSSTPPTAGAGTAALAPQRNAHSYHRM